MMRYLAIFSLLLLLGCIQPQTVGNDSNVSTVIGNTSPLPEPVENQTANETVQENVSTGPTYVYDRSADFGDIVAVNYTLWVDGEVIDTNNETLAKEVGLYNQYRKYDPLVFELAPDKQMINGFVFSIVGMEINETLSFDVEPDKGYGYYDQSKVVVIPRSYNRSLYEVVPRDALEQQGFTNLSEGAGFNTSLGLVIVDELNDDNVTLFYNFEQGKTFLLNGIPQIVTSVDRDTLNATIEFDLEENQTYQLPHPQTGTPTYFRITNKTDEEITLDSNHYLANKTLHFRVTLLSIMEPQ